MSLKNPYRYGTKRGITHRRFPRHFGAKEIRLAKAQAAK